jgi:hypothetical protein
LLSDSGHANVVLTGEELVLARFVDQLEEVVDRGRLTLDHIEVSRQLGEAPADAGEGQDQGRHDEALQPPCAGAGDADAA